MPNNKITSLPYHNSRRPRHQIIMHNPFFFIFFTSPPYHYYRQLGKEQNKAVSNSGAIMIVEWLKPCQMTVHKTQVKHVHTSVAVDIAPSISDATSRKW